MDAALSTSLTRPQHPILPQVAGFIYKNEHTIRSPQDIETYVAALELSKVQEQTFRLECARHFAALTAAMNEIADPMILQYYTHSQASRDEEYINAGVDMQEDVEAAQRRTDERNKRQNSVAKALKKASEADPDWEDYRDHPYLAYLETLGANTLRAFAGLVTAAEQSRKAPDYVILNLSRYILWRLAVDLKHAPLAPHPTRFDLLALTGLFLNNAELRLTTDVSGSRFRLSGAAITKLELQQAEATRRTAKSPSSSSLRIGRRDEVLEFCDASDAVDYPDDKLIEGELEVDDEAELGSEEPPPLELPAKRQHTAGPQLLSPSSADHAAALLLIQVEQSYPRKKQKKSGATAEQIDGWKHKCTCNRFEESAIPDSIRTAIETLRDLAADSMTDRHIQARRQSAVAIARSIDGRRVCYSHCFIFATKAGIYKTSLSHTLLERIIARYGQQDDGYLASEEAAQLIKKAYRDPHPLDEAGLAQVLPCPTAQSPLLFLLETDARYLLDEIFPGMRQRWESDGDVVSDVFGWIFADEEASALIEYEMDMYDYHLRLPPDQPRMGWLRNANFAQIQQLIRMDLLFYAQHVLLHEDHPIRLISYPYEMKLAIIGMNTALSHLDLNAHRVIQDLDGVERYAVRKYIQSAVSLTPEDQGNCTKIIPGMHKDETFREWVKDQPGSTQALNAGVTFTEEHAARFGTRFRYDVTREGEARISDPRLLNSTNGPASRRRAAVFAWLVEHNGQTLANPNTGSVQELSEAHRNLFLGKHLNRPSGYPNKFGYPLTPFPASMQLLSSSALSNAILGRTSFTDHFVQRELRILFGTDANARRQLIDTNRREMLRMAKENWRDQQQIEHTHFGENSFFVNRDIFHQTDHIQRHAEPTFAEEIRLERQRDKKERIQRGMSAVDLDDLYAEDMERGEEEEEEGEEVHAEVTALDGTVLREDEKTHPADAYRRLGL